MCICVLKDDVRVRDADSRRLDRFTRMEFEPLRRHVGRIGRPITSKPLWRHVCRIRRPITSKPLRRHMGRIDQPPSLPVGQSGRLSLLFRKGESRFTPFETEGDGFFQPSKIQPSDFSLQKFSPQPSISKCSKHPVAGITETGNDISLVVQTFVE